ncbi:unnamed protein product [Onchocerca flexuosa]|uniref:Sema domain-containing protein n=1 Tax=Onchocerca flexuosa TaxID=387005 RepID=A0A183H617_9BILA|nr:unnamed protein product [Onchocerca flexuosa]
MNSRSANRFSCLAQVLPHGAIYCIAVIRGGPISVYVVINRIRDIAFDHIPLTWTTREDTRFVIKSCSFRLFFPFKSI